MPVHGDYVATDLHQFSARFRPPAGGRYVNSPAITNETGVVQLPPPVPDHLPRNLLIAGVVAGGAYLALRNSRRNDSRML